MAAHLTSNRAQACQTWWLSVLVSTLSGTTSDWSPVTNHPLAHLGHTDSRLDHQAGPRAPHDQWRALLVKRASMPLS